MDILPLAAHVLQQHGTPGVPYRITDEARRRLLAYHWPGNVRELGNVIQRALVLCPDRTLTEDHLLFDDDVFGQESAFTNPAPAARAAHGGPAGSATRFHTEHHHAGGAPDGTSSPIEPSGPIATHQSWPGHDAPNAPIPQASATHPLNRGWEPAHEAASAFSSERLAPEHGRPIPTMELDQPAAAGLQWAVRHSELRVILDAIRNTTSREAAARVLGISPRTLRYKLAQMRDLGMMTAEAAN
jgi:two-component system response regulator FlrC